MIEHIIYIISISLQVAGALLLVFYTSSTKRESVVRKFIGKGLISRNNNTYNIEYKEEAFFEEYKMAYISKLAFLYILGGYLLCIWGKLKDGKCNKIIAFLFVLILSIFIMFITDKLVELYLKRTNKIYKITNEELNELGLEPNAENISNEEIDKLFELDGDEK